MDTMRVNIINKLSKWVGIILFVLITAILILFLFDFYNIITKSARNAEEEHLKQNTRTSALMVREKMQSDLNTVYALSNIMSVFESIDSPEARAFLKKAGNEYPFSALMISDMNGRYYTNNNREINISNRQYLIGTVKGDRRISVIYKNALYGRDMIALESPIYQNEKIVGKASGLYYTTYINNILSPTGDENGHQYQIIDRNGNFILSSALSVFYGHKDIYSYLDSVEFKDSGKSAFFQDLIKGVPGVTSYISNGKHCYLSFMPIGINGWYLIAEAPTTGINLQTMSMNNPTVTLALRIIALFIILILYIIWRQMRYRIFMERSQNQLEMLNERLLVKNESLKIKAENDLLTGLYNKITSARAISEFLENEGKEGRHALFILDLDNFKKINDEWGHLYGDKAITEVANIIDHCLRTTDIKGRVGGDEFVILLKHFNSDDDLIQKAMEISDLIKQIQLLEFSDWQITASIGISIYPDHTDNYTDLFEKADKAMYYSKELGKGTYYIYNNEIEN